MSRRIGQFEKVTISTDGPDVLLQIPKNPCRAHWTDILQVANGLYMAIKQAQDWEKINKKNGNRP